MHMKYTVYSIKYAYEIYSIFHEICIWNIQYILWNMHMKYTVYSITYAYEICSIFYKICIWNIQYIPWNMHMKYTVYSIKYAHETYTIFHEICIAHSFVVACFIAIILVTSWWWVGLFHVVFAITFQVWFTVTGALIEFYPYPSRPLHWHWGNHMIAPVTVKQPWRIWVKCTITKLYTKHNKA